MDTARDFSSPAPLASQGTEPANDLASSMFRDIIINRSLPSLRNTFSRLPADAVATLLRTPDANRDNATPFLLACLSGNQSICDYLYELGSDIRAKSSSGSTAVHYAVQSSNCDVLQWLLSDLDLDPHIPDSLGRTATHIAASMGSVHMLQSLHLNKCLSFDPDENGSTPLHLAARHGSVDCVQVLLAAGHPSVATDSLGCSPLHVACMEHNMGVINVLAQVGIIDEYDSSGASPLMICVGKGMEEAVHTLLKYGARATHRDYTGRSCLHAVLNLRHDDPKMLSLQQRIASVLIKHSGDVNARDTLGRSPCHIASEKGNVEMLKFFIDSGADVSVADSSGKTCLTQLSRENFNEVTQILIDRIIPLSHQQRLHRRAANFLAIACDTLCMYVFDKLELPVPAELNLHFEMLKSIRHMCQTLCEIPSAKHAAPLLNYACRTGNNGLLLFCLKMGGNLTQSIVPKRGLTCMHLAAQFGHIDIVHTILRVANKMNMAKCLLMFDRAGWTCLHYAVYHGHAHIVAELLRFAASKGFARAFMNRKAIHGETAIHVAFASDREDCVRYLLSAGAKIDVDDRYNLLPATIAGPSLSKVMDGVGLRRMQDFSA